jgi:DNA repair exonuclease SbcCD ATPase subunit
MKDIKFIRVGMENFCSYIDPMIYDFENGKLKVIIGPNGAGKSTIGEALCFALYGTTTKGLRSDEVVNNKVGKNCSVFVDLMIGSDVCRVERYVSHSTHGDTAYFYINDLSKPIKKGHREVLAEVENTILPLKLFINVLSFGQKVKTFFTDLTDSEQKDIFRKIMTFDKYDTLYAIMSQRIKDTGNEIENCKNSISTFKSLYSNHEEDVERFKKQKKEFLESKKSTIKEILEQITRVKTAIKLEEIELDKFEKDLQKDLDIEKKFKYELSSKKSSIEKLRNSELDGIKSKGTVTKSELAQKIKDEKFKIIKYEQDERDKIRDSDDKELSDLKLDITKLKSNETSLNNEISSLRTQAKDLKKEIERMTPSDKDSICFACGQVLNKEHKEKILKMIEEKKETLNQIITKGKSLTTTSTNLNEEIKKLEGWYKEKESDREVKINKIILYVGEKTSSLKEEYETKLAKIEKDIQKILLDARKKYDDELIDLANDISSHDENIELLEEKIQNRDSILEKIESFKKNIDILIVKKEEVNKKEFDDSLITTSKQKMEDCLEKIKNKEIEELHNKKLLGIQEFWKKGCSMSGIPSMLIDEALPFMNQTIAEYLEKMGGRYKVSFDTLSETKGGEIRDKIKINVFDTESHANTRKQLSGGQVRMVDIATIFTLRDLQSMIQDTKMNIFLLDEIFDSLDDKNVVFVSEILRKMVKEYDLSVNLISHRLIDQIDADEVLKLN